MREIRPEKTIESELVYDGKVISVRRDRVRVAGDQTAVREIIQHAPVVVMVPILPNGDLLLVRQYRKPIERVTIELPAGGVESEESLEDAVRREMREETGYTPAVIRPLATIFSTPGISDETMHLFVVTDLVGDGIALEPTDEITVESISIGRAREMVVSGAICDAKSVVGVLMLESGR